MEYTMSFIELEEDDEWLGSCDPDPDAAVEVEVGSQHATSGRKRGRPDEWSELTPEVIKSFEDGSFFDDFEIEGLDEWLSQK
jgi:hypothetical protein